MAIAFPFGRLVITSNAHARLPHDDVLIGLRRHSQGDWGDVCAEDRRANDDGLVGGDRLLSVYHTVEQVKFWIITERDRSVTTVLLPEDY